MDAKTLTKNLNRALPRWAFAGLERAGQSPMVFVTGARQVGKTFIARELSDAYFNWDTAEVRKQYAQDPYFFRGPSRLVVFDEIHKRRDWKKILKGYYDSADRRENFIGDWLGAS